MIMNKKVIEEWEMGRKGLLVYVVSAYFSLNPVDGGNAAFWMPFVKKKPIRRRTAGFFCAYPHYAKTRSTLALIG